MCTGGYVPLRGDQTDDSEVLARKQSPSFLVQCHMYLLVNFETQWTWTFWLHKCSRPPNYFFKVESPEDLLRSVCVCSVASDILWPPWTVAHQVPLCIEFSRQEYWSGFPIPFFRGFSWPRDWKCISFIFCVSRQILYHCTTWEAPLRSKSVNKWSKALKHPHFPILGW